MATREEIIHGLELVIQEGLRVGTALTDDQWAKTVDLDGWKNREVLAHVASIGSIVQPMMSAWSNAPAGADVGAGLDINALNEQLVAARREKSIADLADEVATTYAGVIEFVKNAPDDLLARPITIMGYKDVPASDLLIRMVVLHGLAHIYSAYSAVMMG